MAVKNKPANLNGHGRLPNPIEIGAEEEVKVVSEPIVIERPNIIHLRLKIKVIASE